MNTHSLRTILRRRNLVSLIATCMLLLVAVCGFVASRAQQSPAKDEREVADKIPKHLPIKVKVKNPEKANDLNNDRWLGDLEIEVKNTGDKPIYFLRIGLTFEDVRKNSGDQIGYSLVYGRGELIDIESRPLPTDFPIPPGGTYVFKLHESYVKGWNWYKTKVEKKPHPKKVAIIFSAVNFGDGTGFVGTDGTSVPEKKPPIKGGQSEWPKTTSQGELIRPSNSIFQQASFLLPAETSPADSYTEERGNLPAGTIPAQSCCTGGPNCFRLKLLAGGNCFCPPPPEDPEPSFHVVEDGFQCQGAGYSCKKTEAVFSDCGEGETYHTCTQEFLVACNAPTPTPTPPPTPPPTQCFCASPNVNEPNRSCECYELANNGGFVWVCDSCGVNPQVDFCEYPATGCPEGTENDGSTC